MTQQAILPIRPDFSLVLGGPLFQLFRRAHLSGDALELLHRRIAIITAISWLPLLLLSLLSGHAFGDAVAIPFLDDIEVHVRFLIALPILIGAELIVHRRILPAVQQFVDRGIVGGEDLPKFREAIDSTLRMRNSVVGEVILIVVVYTFGLWVWKNQIALTSASWYAVPDGDQMRLTAAGYWFVFASVPLFQFILLRWYLRFFLWFSLLWKASKLNLRLNAYHPDKSAGLGFLGTSVNSFAPILLAQGALLAGLIASQIFHAGQNLMNFKVQIVAFLAFFIIVLLVPLCVFSGHLVQAKRQALKDLGQLASRYVAEFNAKWTRSAPSDESLLGSADIQSLADLGGCFEVVRETRFVPFGMKDITRLAGIAAIPFLPLLLTIFSLEDFVTRVVKVIF